MTLALDLGLGIPGGILFLVGLAVLIWWLVTKNKKKPPSPPPSSKYAWGVPSWKSSPTLTGGNGKTRLLTFEACSPPSNPDPSMQKACAGHEFSGLDAACVSAAKGAGMCASYQCYEIADDGTFKPASDPDACASESAVYNLTDPSMPQRDGKLSGSALHTMAPDGKLYCTCPGSPAPSIPACGSTINTDTSLKISGITLDPSNYEDNAEKLNAILMEGKIYGEKFTIQCQGNTSEGQDKISSLFCPPGKQVQLCPNSISTNTAAVCRYDASCAKCGNIFGPVGATLNLEVDSDFKYVSHNFTNIDVPNCEEGTSYRGICIPKTMGGSAVADDPDLMDKALPFKIALYHGGKAGLPEINVECMASYLYEVAQFVTYRKIDRVFLSVDSPLPYDVNGTPQQNSYFLQPQFVVANFLRLLPPTVEVGIIAYASPSDSGWNFQACTPYTGETESEKSIAATCDLQWSQHPDLFPLHCDSTSDQGCANCKAIECFANPYAKQLLGGDIDKGQPSCSAFPFTPLGKSANVCVTPCEGSTNCYDALQTVDCAGATQADADKVCQTYVDGHCAPYNTRGKVSCASGKCTMCVPPDEKDAFTRCANCGSCCPQQTAPAVNVPTCASELPSYVQQVESEANREGDVMLHLPVSQSQDALPCGCPNIASQIVAYVTAINDAVDRLATYYKANGQTFSPVKITMIAYDGEDAHKNNEQGGQCQFTQMVSVLDPSLTVYEQSLSAGVGLYSSSPSSPLLKKKTRLSSSTCPPNSTSTPSCFTTDGDTNPNRPTKLGHAYSMSTGPYKWVIDPKEGKSFVPTGITDSFAMPEMYWFMGINFPCVGSSHQIGKTDGWDYAFPPVCTNLLPYNDAVNVAKLDATQLYMWIKMVQKCAPGGGNFDAMVGQMLNYRNRVWPMISCEGLSAGKPGGTEEGNADKDESPWCLARKANKNGDTQASICGTFDGVYAWDDWNTVVQFMNAIYKDTYLNEWGMYKETPMDAKNKQADDDPCIALYEVQFIRPSWMPNKTFNAPSGRPSDPLKYDASVYTGGTGLAACQGSCADLAPQCDPSVPDEKQCDPTVTGSCAASLQASGRSDCVKGYDFSCNAPHNNGTTGTCNIHKQEPGAPSCGSSTNTSSSPRSSSPSFQSRGANRVMDLDFGGPVPFMRFTAMHDVGTALAPQSSHPPSSDYYGRADYAWSILRPHNTRNRDDDCASGGCGPVCKGGDDGKGCCCSGAPTCKSDDDCCQAYGYAKGCKNTCCNNDTCSITSSMAPCTTGDQCDGTDGNCCPGLGNKCVPYESSYLCGRKDQALGDDPTCGPPSPSEACKDGDTCVCNALYGPGNTQCRKCQKNADCTASGDQCLPCAITHHYSQCDSICPQ